MINNDVHRIARPEEKFALEESLRGEEESVAEPLFTLLL